MTNPFPREILYNRRHFSVHLESTCCGSHRTCGRMELWQTIAARTCCEAMVQHEHRSRNLTQVNAVLVPWSIPIRAREQTRSGISNPEFTHVSDLLQHLICTW